MSGFGEFWNKFFGRKEYSAKAEIVGGKVVLELPASFLAGRVAGDRMAFDVRVVGSGSFNQMAIEKITSYVGGGERIGFKFSLLENGHPVDQVWLSVDDIFNAENYKRRAALGG